MAAKQVREFVLQIPNVGLKKPQIDKLKKSFHNELVSSLGPKALARMVIRIRIRVVVVLAQV